MGCFFLWADYLQPAQDFIEQLVQAVPPPTAEVMTFPEGETMPNIDMSFSNLIDPHFVHLSSFRSCSERISSSNSFPH